jgi:hypothetical protein
MLKTFTKISYIIFYLFWSAFCVFLYNPFIFGDTKTSSEGSAKQTIPSQCYITNCLLDIRNRAKCHPSSSSFQFETNQRTNLQHCWINPENWSLRTQPCAIRQEKLGNVKFSSSFILEIDPVFPRNKVNSQEILVVENSVKNEIQNAQVIHYKQHCNY